jgi:tRNA uridine 5-carbamoylmethylation protein Kti12
MTFWIFVGMPGSSRGEVAKDLLSTLPNSVVISRYSIRSNISRDQKKGLIPKTTMSEIEDEATRLLQLEFLKAIKTHSHVINTDTNIKPDYREFVYSLARRTSTEATIVFINEDLQECKNRYFSKQREGNLKDSDLDILSVKVGYPNDLRSDLQKEAKMYGFHFMELDLTKEVSAMT